MQPPVRGTNTVRDVIDRYLCHVRAINLFTPHSLDERKRTFHEFVQEFGAYPLANLRAYHLSDWIESHGGWRASSTRNGKSNQINAAFNWAVRQGRIESNPFKHVGYPESDPRPAMEDAQLEAVLRIASKPFELACRFLRLTGCRLGELCSLTWSNVDFERGLVLLQKHKTAHKTRKPKVFALPGQALLLLKGMRSQPAPSNDYVFVNCRGRQWNRRTLGQNLMRLKLKGVINTKATLHGIRHRFGTEAIRQGAPLKMVSLQMGHTSTAITEKYYCALADEIEGLRRAAEASIVR